MAKGAGVSAFAKGKVVTQGVPSPLRGSACLVAPRPGGSVAAPRLGVPGRSAPRERTRDTQLRRLGVETATTG
jgi:hypothetical protein